MEQESEKLVRYYTADSWSLALERGSFKNLVVNISKLLDRIAGFAIALTMTMVVANVLMRVLFKKPILGALEYAGFFTAVAIGFSLAFCAASNGHIAVDLFLDRLKPQLRKYIDSLMHLIATVFLGAFSWGLILSGKSSAVSGSVSLTTKTPIYPFIYLVAIGFFVFALVQLVKLVDSLGEVVNKYE